MQAKSCKASGRNNRPCEHNAAGGKTFLPPQKYPNNSSWKMPTASRTFDKTGFLVENRLRRRKGFEHDGAVRFGFNSLIQYDSQSATNFVNSRRKQFPLYVRFDNRPHL